MRTTRSSSPVAALSLLLLVVLCFFFHCASATARPLPATTVPIAQQENDSVKAAAADLVLQDGATGNGEEVSELMGAEEETCEEGNDECMQRRLLRDAHLDYIYTQHKKP
uniref:Phytosulfokine n=1 Tax=Leersia perrieri TaxID=77586 RepID=A0A0D9XWX1_9ORYZ